ncbi:MAG: LysM peptidoglycan-binding domain-containing protein [Elusimicrobiota bacterium]
MRKLNSLKHILIITLVLFIGTGMLFSEESSYTVNTGDSLWKIATDKYGTGFEWKKIWTANPGIKNPNLIFPGDTILLPDASTLAAITEPSQPAQMQETPSSSTPAAADTNSAASSAAQPQEKVNSPANDNTDKGEKIAEGQVETEQEEEKPAATMELRTTDKSSINSGDKYTTDSFIVPEKINIDGKIVGSQDDKFLISQGDIVYLNFGKNKGAKAGLKCIVYRISKSVISEDTGKDIGTAYLKTGVLEISSDVEDDVSTARVSIIYTPLEIGDLVRLIK